ncbi:MAG: MATE family efflux transporter [Minwuia sp.]|nr:MATE family efflux transporter [Minwuia sp.]
MIPRPESPIPECATIDRPSQQVSVLSRLRHGALFGLVNRASLGVLNIAVAMVLTRLLSPADFGFYTVFVQIVAVGAMIQSFGMQTGVTKLAGIAGGIAAWDQARAVFRATVKLYLIMAVVVSVLFLLLWPALESHLFGRPLGWIIGGLICLVILTRAAEEIGASYLRGVGRARAGALLLSAPREAIVFAVALAVLLMSGSFDVRDTVQLYAAASALIALAALLVCMRFTGRHHGGPQGTEQMNMRQLAVLSAPILIHSAGAVVLKATDVWILSLYRPAEEVAFYGAAVRVTNLVLFALSVINIALPQLLASMHAQGRARDFERLARTAATWSTVVSVPVFFIVLFFAEPLLVTLFGAPYGAGATVLIILAAGQTVSAVVGSPGMMLQMTGHQRLLSGLTLGALVVNVIANVLVVDDYGMEGVAIVTACTITGRMALHTWFAWRLTGALSLPDPRTLTPSALKAMLRRR